MREVQGNLSIDSENIFPIIKKWLYSDHDIFVRELISNGCDAITKLKKLDVIGEAELEEGYKAKITVTVSPEDRTIEFSDNGIGMTDEEVNEYINQIAFSGATEFIEKYKDKTGDEQIIGHFGLGFYSAFMVADKVTIDTLSYKDGAEPVFWESEGGMEFSMKDGERSEVGTTITLYLNDDTAEFCNEYRVREIIEKYCSFMPSEIYLEKKGEEPKEDAESLSDVTPLWTKHPNDVTDEEYKEFYTKVFRDYKEPLFWIHLNMDYPFNLKGILYFPKVNTEYDNLEGCIKLYNNQVFIADNIKEVIPEFLMLLKGTIDCPDLPLNVSRSALQNDGFVKKISDYITKKVADKLAGMYKVDRENYEKFWDDISPFVKYGCLKDDKFREKIKDYVIFKNLDDKFVTLPEYLDALYPVNEEDAEVVENDADTDSEDAEEKPKKNVYYVTDTVLQSQYINMFKEEGIDALILTHNIDQPFIQQLEYTMDDVAFKRIDSDINDEFTEKSEGEEWDKLTTDLTMIFKEALDNDKLVVEVKKIKNEDVASMIVLSEEARRMQDMMRMYSQGSAAMGMDMDMFGSETLVLNANNALVQYILINKNSENTALFCKQLYDLAMISHKPLAPEAMTEFVARSNKIMMLLAK